MPRCRVLLATQAWGGDSDTSRVNLPGFAWWFNSQRSSCSCCLSHFNELLIFHCLFSLSAGPCSIFAFSALLFVLISMCLTYIFVAICPVITTAVPAASLPSAQTLRGNPPCLAKGGMLQAPAHAGISLQTQAGDAMTLRVLEKENKDEEAKERARPVQRARPRLQLEYSVLLPNKSTQTIVSYQVSS